MRGFIIMAVIYYSKSTSLNLVSLFLLTFGMKSLSILNCSLKGHMQIHVLNSRCYMSQVEINDLQGR